MKKIVVLSMLLIFAIPVDLPAFRDHRSASNTLGTVAPIQPRSAKMHSRLRKPIRLPMDEWDPGRQVRATHRGHKPVRSGHGRHGSHTYWRPIRTTVVREIQPIIIVNYPPPAEPTPPPEPQKTWVPPVMGTRTEPGYWDYGIRKQWMGDHWRYEQDFEDKIWVPEAQVAVVKQEGYWQIIE